MRRYDILFVVLEDTIITQEKIPAGIWDYTIDWEVCGAIKSLHPSKIVIISNQWVIKRGFVKDSSFWSKINYLSHCLSDYCGVPVSFDYSIDGTWKNHEGEGIVEKVLRREKKKRILCLIGK